MEENFNIGDFVKVENTYGTIINIEDVATIYTFKGLLRRKISLLEKAKQFIVGSLVTHAGTNNIFTVEEAKNDGTYIISKEGIGNTKISLRSPHEVLSQVANIGDYVYTGENKFIITEINDKGYIVHNGNLINPENIIKVELTNDKENQLQRKETSIGELSSSAGSRVYGRRPEAKISIGSLSYKARIGYSKC